MTRVLTYAEVFGPGPEDLIFELQEIFGPERRNERHRYGPTGERDRVGGYLEYSLRNRMEFVGYFNPLMPGSLLPTDLMVLSTSWTNRYPDYRLLPPRSLWENMANTLAFLEVVMRKLGVTVTIQSAYRSHHINRGSQGTNGSRHLHFSALDLDPISDVDRFRTYLEHYWWERGDSVKLGLGLYSSGRTHIDTQTRPRRSRWPEGAGHSRSEARRRFERMFGASMTLEP